MKDKGEFLVTADDLQNMLIAFYRHPHIAAPFEPAVLGAAQEKLVQTSDEIVAIIKTHSTYTFLHDTPPEWQVFMQDFFQDSIAQLINPAAKTTAPAFRR